MQLALTALLFGSAAASSSVIRAHSKAGRGLLRHARRLDGGNADISWAVNYSLRFEKCATSSDYAYFGGNQDNNGDNENGNYNYNNGVYEQRLVHFKLCPTDSCGSGCSAGGDYVVDMNEFVQAHLEHAAEAREQECESVANNCYCENANDDDACAAQCYINAGIYDQCVEQDDENNNNNNGQQGDDFELEEALECAELEVDEEAAQYYMYNNQNGDGGNYYNGNNNQNGEQQDLALFVGPYCSANGKAIHLGVFMDEVCSYAAPSGIYEKLHYGNALPYSSESLVSNECISCMQPAEDDGDNNNNQNYNYYNGDDDANNYNQNQDQEDPEVLEMCERLYENAGKCEASLNVYGLYSNTLACDFIQGLGKAGVFASLGAAKASVTPTVLAVLFGASTLVFGGVSYYFHKRLQRQSVGLVHAGGNLA